MESLVTIYEPTAGMFLCVLELLDNIDQQQLKGFTRASTAVTMICMSRHTCEY